jgi:uncharacterized protein
VNSLRIMSQNDAIPSISVTQTSSEDVRPTVRTVTAFLTLRPENFDVSWGSLFSTEDLDAKVTKCVKLLREVEAELTSKGYVVQTIRIATNPFGEWMTVDAGDPAATKLAPKPKKTKIDVVNRLERLDALLARHGIDFCSLGPATVREEADRCIDIVTLSHRFSCSMVVKAGDVESANIAASTIIAISRLGDKPNAPKHVQNGLGNFRFCSASNCRAGIPFFPAAKSASGTDGSALNFAIGLENGRVAQRILKDSRSIQRISTHFKDAFAQLLEPIQIIANSVAKDHNATFLGIDSSLNPSLDTAGSVAAAIEELEEVKVFGGPGTLAAAAEITKALQSLPGIDLTGYCGLMLPVCEDTRLAELSGPGAKVQERLLRISDVLSVSSVCGVGVDTVPVPGDCTMAQLSSLILDVAGIAGRWNKSLSCRVFPVPEKKAGELTEFDSPYMVNSHIFSLE